MIERIIAYLCGFVVIRVHGANRVRFINACAKAGISQWSVRMRHGDVLLCTSVSGFKAMRKPARQYKCSVRVVARRGLPFFVLRLRRRAVFSLGAVVFVLLLWLLSSFIWFIEVEGSAKITAAEMEGYLRKKGLHVGAWRSSIDHERIASAILKDYPELAWAGIAIERSRAHVKLVDKAVVIPQERVPGDIVAAKAGLLLRVIATSGQAKVNGGITVSPGQLLISGTVVVEGEVASKVMAEGIAEARVWYEALGHAQVSRDVECPTNKIAKSDLIRISGRDFHLAGPRISPFELYESDTTKRILLPGVEHITITYHELAVRNETITREQAIAEATNQAEERMKSLLPEAVSIVETKITDEWSADGNTVTVRILVETIEDIGRFSPY